MENNMARKLNVLIVDDDRSTIHVLTRIIETRLSDKFFVHGMSDSAAALALKQANPFGFYGPRARAGGRAAPTGRPVRRFEFSFGHQGLLSWLGATADRNNRVPASVGRTGRRPYDAAARRVVSNAAG